MDNGVLKGATLLSSYADASQLRCLSSRNVQVAGISFAEIDAVTGREAVLVIATDDKCCEDCRAFRWVDVGGCLRAQISRISRANAPLLGLHM